MRRRRLVVRNRTVLDGQNERSLDLIANVANNPVIPNPIRPQPTKLMTQRLTEAARVFLRRNPGIHVVENFPLHSPVNRPQVLFNPRVVFNRPGQGYYATDQRLCRVEDR